MVDPNAPTSTVRRRRPAAVRTSGSIAAATAAAACESDTSIGPCEREAMIRQAAYHRAKNRSFVPGKELEDWLAAEQEINQKLADANHALHLPLA